MAKDFIDFVDERAGSLLKFAWLLTGSQQDAEDLSQEALLRVYSQWRRVKSAANSAAYANRILVNCHIDRMRKGRLLTCEISDDLLSGDTDVAELVIDRDSVRGMLDSLPSRQRTIVVLRYFEQMSTREISLALEIGESTVRSALARSLATLKAATSIESRDK